MTDLFIKDPSSKEDYTVNWTTWLGDDTISASAWTVPSGLTQSTPSPSNTATAATIWISGGTHGQEYLLMNQITTAAGRINQQSIKILVRDK